MSMASTNMRTVRLGVGSLCSLEGLVHEQYDFCRSAWLMHVRPRQGTEICNFGVLSLLGFWILLRCLFLSLQVFCVIKQGKSPQNVQNAALFPGGEKRIKSCHVSGCHLLLVLRNVASKFPKEDQCVWREFELCIVVTTWHLHGASFGNLPF